MCNKQEIHIEGARCMGKKTEDKITRLLDMMIVIQMNPKITATALAKKYNVSLPTILRHIDDISRVTDLQSLGRGKGYQFSNDFFDIPVSFTKDEQSMIVLSLSTLSINKNFPMIRNLMDKFAFAKNKSISRRNHMIEDIASIFPTGKVNESKDKVNFLTLIMQATLDQRTIIATYHTQYRDQITKRKIDPYYIIPRDNLFYVIGYCHKEKDIRTFRISRFKQVNIMDFRFVKNTFNLEKYMEYTWNINRGEEIIDFKVRFSKNIARYIKEKELFVKPILTDEPNGSLLFEVTVNNKADFLKWVLQYGIEAEIIEPLYIRTEMRQLIEKWKEIYK